MGGEYAYRKLTRDKYLLLPYHSLYKAYRANKYYLHVPDAVLPNESSEYSYPSRSNSLGFIGQEYPIAKKDSIGIRIISIGDSFTEGIGAPQDSSYPALLQQMLNSDYPKPIEVINFGLSGSDPFYYYLLCRDIVLKYKPDILLVTFNTSDIVDVNVRGGFERFKADGTVQYNKAPWFEPLYEHSVIFRSFLLNVLHCDFPPGTYKRTEAAPIQKLQIALDSIADLCAQYKMKLNIIFNPVANEVSQHQLNLQPLLQYADSRNIETINLLPYFIQQGGNNVYQYFWKYDMHNNSKGYQLFAQGVYRNLKPQLDSQP